MRPLVRACAAGLLAAHGVIHLIGVAAALHWSAGDRLHESVGAIAGIAWAAAAALITATAVLVVLRRPGWWWTGLAGAVISLAVVVAGWRDAWAGVVPDVVLLLACGYGIARFGPSGFEARYLRQEREIVAASPLPGPPIADDDLAALPPQLAHYLRRCGVVREPRVRCMTAVVHGRIRSGANAQWMPFTARQCSTFGTDPTRLFLMFASMKHLPVDVLHEYRGGHARMRARLCSLVPVVNTSGREMTRAETVTVFNDMCVLAPSALLDAPITWRSLDEHRVRGRYTVNGHMVSADLIFDTDGDLIDFVSADRLRSGPRGELTPEPWSTPVRDYTWFGRLRLATHGEAVWHAARPEGTFTYLEFIVDDICYNTGDGAMTPSDPEPVAV